MQTLGLASQEEGLCTVAFAAAQLGLHRKTILRFIREGRLPARRIGKSYRIRRTDLETFAGLPATAVSSVQKPSVTAIFDLPGVIPALAQRWMTTVTASLKGRTEGGAPMKVEVIYDEARTLLKIVAVGEPGDVVLFLSLVRALMDQLRP